MQYIPIVMSAVQGMSAISGGKDQRKAYEAQAAQDRVLGELRAKETIAITGIQSTQTRLQAIQQRLGHERIANEVLRGVGRTQAAIVARAAAGGVRAFEGSPGKVLSEVGAAGAREYGLSLENAELAQRFGFLQADIIKSQGEAQAALDIAGVNANAAAKDAAGASLESAGFMKGLGFFAEAGFRGYKLGMFDNIGAGGPQPAGASGSYSLLGNFSLVG